MRRITIVFTTAFFLLFLSFVGHAQTQLQLGEFSYSRAPAPHLRIPVSVRPSFFRAVGGVAFDAVAVGKDGLEISKLQYDSERPDGSRLVVSVKEPDGDIQQVITSIYDWQLLPTARFADSDTGSAMTLFGSLDDKVFEKELLQSQGRVINYHPAIDNTLVGLRLMQADIMLFNPNAIYLPKITGGDYILGAGETAPDTEANKRNFEAIEKVLQSESEKGNSYRSYVVGDINTAIEFYVKEGQLVFSGDPTWIMWDDPEEIRKAREFFQLVEAAQSGDTLAMLLLQAKYGDSEQALVAALDRYKSVLSHVKSDDIPVEVNRELSNRVSAAVKLHKGINPAVYDTLTKVMRYRALFRNFRAKDKQAYNQFLASLDNIDLQPKVTTPTVQRRGLLH